MLPPLTAGRADMVIWVASLGARVFLSGNASAIVS